MRAGPCRDALGAVRGRADAGARAVDYILFMTGVVDVTPNLNEIRDYKYVDKAELQAMFEDPCEYFASCARARTHAYATLRATANSFTPWFKLIARDFLFGWWDELLARRDASGKVDATSLDGLVDGSKVVKMV